MDIIPSAIADNAFQVKGFIIIYIASFVPCWVSLFFAVRAVIKRQVSHFVAWSLILILLLLSPYAFVLINGEYNVWQLWALIILFTLFTYYKLFFHQKTLSINWFWNWYAKSYDTLLLFGPYKALISDFVSHIKVNEKVKIKILEIGCGTGNIAWQIKDRKSIEYLGVDSSKEMLKKAQQKLKGYQNFNFIQNDIDNELHKLHGTFDVIAVNNVLYAIEKHSEVIAILRDLVLPGGRIIVSEPLRNSSILHLVIAYIKNENITSFINIITHLPSFVFLLIANLMILEIDHIKEQDFFSDAELVKLLTQNRFSIEIQKNVYEKQNLLLIAKPI